MKKSIPAVWMEPRNTSGGKTHYTSSVSRDQKSHPVRNTDASLQPPAEDPIGRKNIISALISHSFKCPMGIITVPMEWGNRLTLHILAYGTRTMSRAHRRKCCVHRSGCFPCLHVRFNRCTTMAAAGEVKEHRGSVPGIGSGNSGKSKNVHHKYYAAPIDPG